MAIAPTKEEFLEQIRATRNAWEAALIDVGAEGMETPGVSGEWTVRDIVAHTAYGQRWLVGQLEAERLSEIPIPATCFGDALPPHDIDMADDDARNAVYVQFGRGQDLAVVLHDAGLWANRLWEEVNLRAEEDLHARYSIEEMAQVGWLRKANDDNARTFPLWDLIAGYTYRHDPEHTAEIRAWLATKQPKSASTE